MTIGPAKHAVSHPDRFLACQESIEFDLQEIIDKANMRGWGTVETLDAMEEVLRNLRLAYTEDPDPAEEPIMDARLFLHKHPTDEA
jgi:hypothetical protein